MLPFPSLLRMSALIVLLAPSCAAGASVSIASPEDGATVESPFTVSMEADGFAIEPAGEVRKDAGHFHLMVDANCVARGETIPEDANHLHLGDGSMETEVDLPPGQHTLCLQAGDGAHVALDLTDEITITVAGPGGGATEEGEEAVGPQEWEGTVTGQALARRGPCDVTYEGEYTIEVDEGGSATLEGTITGTVGGGCTESSATSQLGPAEGQRTPSGFHFPGLLATDVVIEVSGDHGTGTSEGEGPDSTWEYEFEIDCLIGCPA
jgi:hypothetical protein